MNFKNIGKYILDLINVHPDKNQKWILLSLFISGLLINWYNFCIFAIG